MRTAYCPKSHTELADERVGREYGHVPGHQYHDVDVVVSTRSNRFRVHVCESWGSAQGYDEEHGRREAIGRGESIRDAIENARDRAAGAGIETEYLEQALSLAEDAAEEAAEDAAEEVSRRVYVVEIASGGEQTRCPSYEAAIAYLQARYDRPVIGHDGDLSDFGDRTLVWPDDETAANDDGSNAIAHIRIVRG